MNSEDNYFKAEYIPSWIHLVLWGNEHEPMEWLETSSYGFKVFFAGSTISTSLNESEHKMK